MTYQPQHECTSTASNGIWDVLAECAGEGVSSGGVWGIVIGIVVLGAAGVGIWWLVNKRNQ